MIGLPFLGAAEPVAIEIPVGPGETLARQFIAYSMTGFGMPPQPLEVEVWFDFDLCLLVTPLPSQE